MKEILERLNPPRRLRTYPRVVKRLKLKAQLVKRQHHTGTTHRSGPRIKVKRDRRTARIRLN